GCAEGEITSEGECFVPLPGPETWEGAVLACQDIGMELASILSEQQFIDIREHLNDALDGDYWTGLNDQEVEGCLDASSVICEEVLAQIVKTNQKMTRRISISRNPYVNYLTAGESDALWIGLSQNLLPTSPTDELTWFDGTTYDFTQMQNGADLSGVKCVLDTATPGEWQPVECNELHGFICEKSPTSETVCPGDNMLRLGDTCYTIAEGPITSPRATLKCLEGGAEPVLIHNEYIQYLLHWYVTNNGFQTESFWIGLSDAENEGNHIWYDNSALVYQNWAEGQPDNAGNDDCVKLDWEWDFAWSDARCSETYNYICEFASTPCEHSSDCPELAECSLGQCKCQSGYTGNGLDSCT
ncbi:macrophage mannose receptor 1-like, partial [Saccoglossus kowalevskii]|uniref:Macrophage mannose receptor 1-like n=1 Tax=Saccoglossus kowalevskii TaxID=10224 RepID=A0ABM0MJ39_SACKO